MTTSTEEHHRIQMYCTIKCKLSNWEEMRPFEDIGFAMQTTVFFPTSSKHFKPYSKNSNLIGTTSTINCLYLGQLFQIELIFVNSSYLKVFFPNLKQTFKYLKIELRDITLLACFRMYINLSNRPVVTKISLWAVKI